MQKPQYVSCMYIGGLPILPPLMTAEIRQEMQKYRELAIGIEQRIAKRHDSLTQSETNDSRSDPVTSIDLNASNAKRTNQTSSSLHLLSDCRADSPKIVDSDHLDAETDHDINKSMNGAIRRNSYTLEAPSPQLLALLQSNQIEDVSCSQDSNSESFTEVSKLSNSPKKQPTSFALSYNANSDISCSNPKASETSAGAVSTGSEYDSLSSDVESIVNLTESAERCNLEPRTENSCQSELVPNTTDDSSLKFSDCESNLDISKIKDLKLLSKDDSSRSHQNFGASVKSRKRNINLELRKAFFKRTGVSPVGTSVSLPTSLCSSPEPKHLFHSTEDISKLPSISRIPLSTKIPPHYHKLSEKSQCSFKNTTIRNHLNEAKKVGRIKHDRLYSSLIEDKQNISDDSKSILNQSKLPVYMPLRRSSLGFIPFKPDSFLKKSKPTSFCRRPHSNVKKGEPPSNINERNNSRNLQAERCNNSINQHSSLLDKEMLIDENKNMKIESRAFDESFQKSLRISEEDITSSLINFNSSPSAQSRSRLSFSNMSPTPNNENIYLRFSPSRTNSDVESFNGEYSVIKHSPKINNQSPGRNKVESNSNRNTPVNFSDLTNNNLDLSSGGSRTSSKSRKQLNFNQKNTKSSSVNNSLNNSFCDSVSLSGSEINDLSFSSSRNKRTRDVSDTEISEKSLSLLLQELQNKHQRQMELLKLKQIEEQNMLEQQQKKITETILLNLSNSLSPSSSSPKSGKSDKSPKTPLNYDEVPVNGGLTPVPVSGSSSVMLFNSAPSVKQTDSITSLSRYSLPGNPSKIVQNKIWFMNNIPAAKFYPKKNYNELEIKAATIIQAGIRGYFVRRLMKTERVQLLIEMIQKSIKCAFEIQQEPAPTLADYEFHSRLVQQITKACYEIHEIFIVYPQKERFAIIAADRLKKFQKINNSTPGVKPLSVATRRSLQRKHSQSSNEHSSQALKKPYRPRSHTFTSSSLHDDYSRRKIYERSATTYNIKKPQRLSYDSRISNELKHRAPWR